MTIKMYYSELYAIEKMIDNCIEDTRQLVSQYEKIDMIESIRHESNKFLMSEKLAYSNSVQSLTLFCSKYNVPHIIEAIPKELDTLDMESFRSKFKEVKDSFWKALSEAFDRFAKLISRWYVKLKEFFGAKSTESSRRVETIKDTLIRRDKIAERYNLKRGDKLTKELIKEIMEAEGDLPNKTEADIVLNYEDYERDIVSSFGQISKDTSIFDGLSINGDVSNIQANVKQAHEMLAKFTNSSFTNTLVGFITSVLNISNREELISFIEKDMNKSNEAFVELHEIGQFSKGNFKPNEEYTGPEVIGGKALVMTYHNSGIFVYPTVRVGTVKVNKGKSSPRITVEELIGTVHNNSTVEAIADEASRINNIITDAISRKMDMSGKGIKESHKSIVKSTTDREKSDSDEIIKGIKNINIFKAGWSSYTRSIATLATDITTSIDKILTAIEKDLNRELAK